MQPNLITVSNGGSNPVDFVRYEENLNSSLYVVRGLHSVNSPYSMQLRRTLPTRNLSTGYPGNRRSSVVFRLGDTRTASVADPVSFEAIASVELSWVIPAWDNPDKTTELLALPIGFLANSSVAMNLVKILEI